MGSRPKMIFSVHGSRECRMQDMLFVVHYIGEQFIVCLFHQFFDSFSNAFPWLRENAVPFHNIMVIE